MPTRSERLNRLRLTTALRARKPVSKTTDRILRWISIASATLSFATLLFGVIPVAFFPLFKPGELPWFVLGVALLLTSVITTWQGLIAGWPTSRIFWPSISPWLVAALMAIGSSLRTIVWQ